MFSTAKLVIVSVIAFVLVGAFWHVSGLRADLEKSRYNVRTLESSVEKQVDLINQMQKDYQKTIGARDEIRNIIDEQREQISDLSSRFNESADGSKRDFGYLALNKPGLVENIVNSASKNSIRCIEIASGATLTKEEINAGYNSECTFDTTP